MRPMPDLSSAIGKHVTRFVDCLIESCKKVSDKDGRASTASLTCRGTIASIRMSGLTLV